MHTGTEWAQQDPEKNRYRHYSIIDAKAVSKQLTDADDGQAAQHTIGHHFAQVFIQSQRARSIVHSQATTLAANMHATHHVTVPQVESLGIGA